jgi:hypothetical protein
VIVERSSYRLELAPHGRFATLRSPAGDHWLTLSLLASFDRVGAVDETLAVEAPQVNGSTITVARTSTIWERAGVTLECDDASLTIGAWVENNGVEGEGRLTNVHLLGGRYLPPTPAANGFFATGTSFRTLFSSNPGDPAKLVRSAAEPAVLGCNGDGMPGRGHWFFTPPPLYLALSTDEVDDPESPSEGGWLGLGLAAPVEQLTFVQASYVPGDRSFHLVLEHEGHTQASRRYDAPAVVLTPAAPTPYAGLRAHRDDLAARGAAPPVVQRDTPAWWSKPMFCGWGAQCHLSSLGRGPAPSLATQVNYDGFLAALEEHGLVPGTIVIDDKWQETYGQNDPDRAKWPDLRAWIDDRHERGQHVLLWWKAWDPEGLPDELCIRRPDGVPVAADPTNPRLQALLRDVMHDLVGPGGLDADGLKIDFTARTPSGHALTADGDGWGISLLHQLLSVVYAEVKHSKPGALVITQTPHPSFADVTDMVRLNDMLRLDDPGPLPVSAVVPQMRYRALVAKASLPDVLIDTDDWCIPDKRTWREYLELKSELGVQSLYYATHLDLTGEALDEDDYAALRRAWGVAQ